MRPIAIIGGGITGLSLGHFLHRASLPFVILEKSEQLGGSIHTEAVGDFLLEIGPNTLLGKPSVLSLVDSLKIEPLLERSTAQAKKRYLALPSERDTLELVALPQNAIQALGSPVLSTSAKLRMLLEPCVSRTNSDDISVYDFVSRRLGRQVSEILVGAALSGIWAADTKRLSTRSSLPKLWQLEQHYGSLALGSIRSKRDKSKAPRPRAEMLSFRGGLVTLVQALASSLPPSSIRCACPLVSIEPMETGFLVCIEGQEPFTAARVISTVSAKDSALLIKQFAPDLAREISEVPYAPLGVLHFSVEKSALPAALDGFGFLVPPTYGNGLMGCIYSSCIFSGRAPDSSELLTCFTGGMHFPECADVTQANIQQQVADSLSQLMALSTAPKLLNATYYPDAIPNYPLGHYKLLEQLAQFEVRYPGLHFLSNWREGISVPDRISLASQMANSIIDNEKPL